MIEWRSFSLDQVNRRAGEGVDVWDRAAGYESPGLAAFAGSEAVRRQASAEAWETFRLRLLDTRHAGAREVFTPEVVERVAASVGVDVERYRRDLRDPAILERVAREHQEAAALGVFGTPTLVFENGACGYLKLLPPPTGDEGLRTWELVRGVIAEQTQIGEIKRPKSPTTG